MQNQSTSVYIPVETPDNKFWAFLLALLVHIAILGFIIYTNHVKNLDGEAMETSIVTPDELAAMQGQIKANQAANATAQANNGTYGTALTQNPEAAKLNAELAQKQAKWQQQQAVIAAQLDKQAMQEQQEFANQLKQNQIEEVKTLDKFKSAETTLDSPQHRDAAPQSKAGDPLELNANNANENGIKTARNAGQAQGASQGSSKGTGNNAQTRADYKRTVERIVESNWTPPAGTPVGKKVSANFSISDTGQIGNINVNSGDTALDDTLIQALNASSLPPPPTDTGANYASNNMAFIVKPR